VLGPALLAALVVLLFAPLALGRSFWLRDLLEFTYPLKAYLIERMRAGELALWNPRLGLGRPFAGVVQPGVFYPLDVVLLVARYPRGVDLFFALHAFIAGLGMRAWLRARGPAVDETAATFGGALYALSGYLVSVLVGNGTYAVGAAWLPWALSSPLSPVRIAVPMALMVLGGDPEAAWLAAALVLVEAATHAERKRALLAGAAGFGLAVALAAVQLGPALEVARVGRPGGVALADASHFSFPPLRLFELVWPDLFGPRYGADWLLHPLYDEGTGWAYEPWSAGIYVGLATPLLALAALVGRDARRRERALAAVAAVALVVAFGRHTPLWAAWFRFVPGARLFRYPEKYLVVVTLMGCALAAVGLPRVVATPRRSLFAGVFVVGALAAGALFAQFFGGAFFAARLGRLEHGSAAELGAVVAASARHALLIAVVTLLPLVLALRGRLSLRTTTLVVAAIVVIDLFAQSITLTDYVPSALYQETPPPVAAARALAGGQLLRLYRPLYNEFSSTLPPPVARRATLRPNCGVDDGVDTLDAYDNFPALHEQALWAALGRQPLRLLAVTATRFALLPPGLFAPHDGFIERAHWPALGALLAEATTSPPRAYLATSARVADDAAAASLLAVPDFAPGRSLVLAPADGARDVAAADGRCTLVDDRPEQVTLACHAGAPTYAVLADAWFPGWYATVDGTPAPILRANLAMRAVPIPAGDSKVAFVYRPAHLRAGFVVSLLALLACCVIRMTSSRRQRA
jgi:hypothetical protein